MRDGRLRTNIGNVASLDEAVAAFNPKQRIKGKTIIRVRPEGRGDSKPRHVVMGTDTQRTKRRSP